MIVITGASGQLGRLVIASLLTKVSASELVAVVRNPEKASDIAALGVQVRQADYNQADDWHRALQGASKVLLISSNELGQRTEQHRNVINAAKNAGVALLAYTSILHADTSVLELAAEHRATEADIRTSGVPFVMLRNGWYTENYTLGIATALALGAVYGCAGDGLIASAARADYAEAAAVVLTSDNQAGKTYELAGDTAYTLSEFAAEISLQSGKAIGYINLAESDYKQALLNAGLPEPLAKLLADSDSGAAKGALFDTSRQLSRLIGRPTASLATAVKAQLPNAK